MTKLAGLLLILGLGSCGATTHHATRGGLYGFGEGKGCVGAVCLSRSAAQQACLNHALTHGLRPTDCLAGKVRVHPCGTRVLCSSPSGGPVVMFVIHPGQRRVLPISPMREGVKCSGDGDSIQVGVPKQSSTTTVGRFAFDKKLSLSVAPWGAGSRHLKPRLIAVCRSR